jgi:hypothetical protein
MTAHALLSHQSIRRKRDRGSHPELDEAAAAGIHGSSAVHRSTTAILSDRLWDQSEIARGATLVLVNQSFVRHYLSGGILSGLVLSFGLGRMIAQWIENGTRDPMVVLGVSVILLAVAAIAALVPARRALAINLIEALRSE